MLLGKLSSERLNFFDFYYFNLQQFLIHVHSHFIRYSCINQFIEIGPVSVILLLPFVRENKGVYIQVMQAYVAQLKASLRIIRNFSISSTISLTIKSVNRAPEKGSIRLLLKSIFNLSDILSWKLGPHCLQTKEKIYPATRSFRILNLVLNVISRRLLNISQLIGIFMQSTWEH